MHSIVQVWAPTLARNNIESHRLDGIANTMYMPIATSNSTNVNSCVFAADMITTMAGADPGAVRADLGCLPGMDCEVNNHLVFNVMDRYTGPGVGL